jgi:hypothetical protein
LQEGAASRQGDSPVHDVAGELRRGAIEGVLDRVEDVGDRFVERLADLGRAESDRFRQAGDEVAAADLDLDLLRERRGRTGLELDLLTSSAVWVPIASL